MLRSLACLTCLALFLVFLGLPVQAVPTIEWVPVGVSPSGVDHTIDGHEVTIRELVGGLQVELEMRLSGWGTTAGSPALGAYGATLDAPLVDGGITAPVRIKGWPDAPEQGAYIIAHVCSVSNAPCSPPFDPSCSGGIDGTCDANPDFVFSGGSATVFFPPDGGSDIFYGAVGTSGRVDDGQSYHAGYLLLEPTGYAAGSVTIGLATGNGASFMISANGIPIEGLTVTPAVITFRSGMCCWFPSNESTTRCEDLMEVACSFRPQPVAWFEGLVCPAECACPSCSADIDCNDGDACTDDVCETCSGLCLTNLAYDPAVECCNSVTGVRTTIDDGDECSLVTCVNGLPVFAPSCDDGNVCTLAVPCDPDPGCTFQTPEEADIFCTQQAQCPPGWACDGAVNRCVCTEPVEPRKGKCCIRDFNGADPNRLACNTFFTQSECFAISGAVQWTEGEHCIGPCPCQDCAVDAHCDDGDPCTAGVCVNSCSCEYVPSYDGTTHCCDSATGVLTSLDDGNTCTRDDCGAVPGTTTHTIVTAMPCEVQDRCAFATCNDAGICTGVWPEDAAVSCTQDADCPDGWQCNTETSLCDCIFDVDALKNRYITFEPQALGSVAYQVRMTASAYFPGSTGTMGWVGQPDVNRAAGIVGIPFFSDSWPSKVHVGNCRIVPVATYEVLETTDGVNFAAPVVVETIPAPSEKFWGDAVGDFDGVTWGPPNGVTNFGDVQAAIKTFQGGESATPTTWTDVEPEEPNRVVNFNDVLQLVFAFTGLPYPFGDPANCP